jgi:branched-subunit amino acid ABC-type transport system permease component
LVEVNIFQLIVDSSLNGAVYVLVAVGLTFIYRIMGFPNFAHAEFVTFGAYAALVANTSLGLDMALSAVVGFLASGTLAVFFHSTIFTRLSTTGSKAMPMMIASIGIGLVIRHTIQELWGSGIVYYDVSVPAVYEFLGARVTATDLLIISSSALLVISLHLLLSRTTIGKAMRATADNKSLALVSGINTHHVLLVVWFLSGGAAGLAGVLRGLDTRLIPLLGWNIILPAFAVVILGGIGSFYGVILAAYILGFAENIGVVALISLSLSNSYRPAIPFAILIIMLILRPQGLLTTFRSKRST